MALVSVAGRVAEMSLVAPDRGHPELFSDVTYVGLDSIRFIFMVLQNGLCLIWHILMKVVPEESLNELSEHCGHFVLPGVLRVSCSDARRFPIFI